MAQQDYNKKSLEIEFLISVDYETYILEYLLATKSENDDRYYMLKSPFLFYNFNDFISQ